METAVSCSEVVPACLVTTSISDEEGLLELSVAMLYAGAGVAALSRMPS